MLGFVEKRKLSEVKSLYSLEPTLKDIYVEGISDKIFYEHILEDSVELEIIEIDFIDFSEVDTKIPEVKCNNKAKVIELSNYLFDEFGDKLKYISCVVDLDFDNYNKFMIWNVYLYYTDYCSFELYFYNEDCISKFNSVFLHRFPIIAKELLNSFTPILRYLFFLRKKLRGKLRSIINPEGEFRIIDIGNKKLINIDKEKGTINFNQQEHLERVLIANSVIGYKDEIEESINNLLKEDVVDCKKQIVGHDFIHLLFLFIKKIKNDYRLNEEVIARALPLCANPIMIREEELFKRLVAKYQN